MKRSAKKVHPISASAFEGPEQPAGRRHRAIEDVRAQFAALTAKQPVDEAFQTAFMQSKITVAHTHPTLDLGARDAAVKSVTDRLGSGANHAFAHLIARGYGSSGPPVPGRRTVAQTRFCPYGTVRGVSSRYTPAQVRWERSPLSLSRRTQPENGAHGPCWLARILRSGSTTWAFAKYSSTLIMHSR